MARENRRGKPFDRQQREYFAMLIRQRGIRGTQEASAVPVSIPTLCKIAREFRIILKKGKRRRDAALTSKQEEFSQNFHPEERRCNDVAP